MVLRVVVARLLGAALRVRAAGGGAGLAPGVLAAALVAVFAAGLAPDFMTAFVAAFVVGFAVGILPGFRVVLAAGFAAAPPGAVVANSSGPA